MKKAVSLSSQICKGILTLIIGLSAPAISQASHIAGTEITYEWVSGNTYKIKLFLYRDCSGIAAPASLSVNYKSTSCGTGLLNATLLKLPGSVPVTPICQASLANSSCNGGNIDAIEQITYETTITLPLNCTDWIFSFSECCRSGLVTNVSTPGLTGIYVSTMLNNSDVPFNNSPSFIQTPINIIPNNVTTHLSWTVFDDDGDSLIYELISANQYSGGNVVPLTYNPGYSYLQPFSSSLSTSLNYANGILTVTPNMIQTAIVCMKVSEYRNGFFIGYVIRDFQLTVTNSTNNTPALTGMNGTSNFVTNGCPGDTITFDVFSSDPDAGQILTLSMNTLGTGAGLNSSGGANPTGTFTWAPTSGDISSSPYHFVIKVADDNCTYYGTQSYDYLVFVNGCNTNVVWPGDANADGDANLYDLLPIGIAYNDAGPLRPSATLNWVAQPCPDWTNSFISGINHKHADTDGDGTVTLNDTLAIFQNYGLNHPLRNSNPGLFSIADLSITASDDTVGLSAVVHFDISISTPVDSLYGLAFRLYFDTSMIDLNSIMVTYPGSVFGTNQVDMIKMDRSQGMNGYVDIALSRINQLNLSGTGPVARVTIVTTDNVSGKVVLNVAPIGIVGTTLYEAPVIMNAIGTDVVIDPNFTGIGDDLEAQLLIYPAPVSDYLHINYTGNLKVHSIKIYDVNGREIIVLHAPATSSIIDLHTQPAGMYLLKAIIGDREINKKIMVF